MSRVRENPSSGSDISAMPNLRANNLPAAYIYSLLPRRQPSLYVILINSISVASFAGYAVPPEISNGDRQAGKAKRYQIVVCYLNHRPSSLNHFRIKYPHGF